MKISHDEQVNAKEDNVSLPGMIQRILRSECQCLRPCADHAPVNKSRLPALDKTTNFMELRLLRYFQAIAEELSFSRASRRLRVAQPALSRALKELEEEVGAQLLERNRRKVSLTPAGAVQCPTTFY